MMPRSIYLSVKYIWVLLIWYGIWTDCDVELAKVTHRDTHYTGFSRRFHLIHNDSIQVDKSCSNSVSLWFAIDLIKVLCPQQIYVNKQGMALRILLTNIMNRSGPSILPFSIPDKTGRELEPTVLTCGELNRVLQQLAQCCHPFSDSSWKLESLKPSTWLLGGPVKIRAHAMSSGALARSDSAVVDPTEVSKIFWLHAALLVGRGLIWPWDHNETAVSKWNIGSDCRLADRMWLMRSEGVAAEAK